MVKTVGIGLLMAVLCLLPATSFAQTHYFIDLGNAPGEEAARARWQELSSRYPDIGKLAFSPRMVSDFNGQATTQMLAGPVDSKAQAQKICTRLFKENVPCFVFEGVDVPPPAASAEPLPWLAKPAPSPTEERKGFFSWLFDWGGSAQKDSNDPKAKVEVAEAIHVPLTSDYRKRQELRMQPVFESAPVNKPIVSPPKEWRPPVVTAPRSRGDLYQARRQRLFGKPRKPSAAPAAAPAYWVQVASAPDQIEAMSSWRSMRDANADLLQGLRTRVSTTLLGSGYVVRVGPIQDSGQAAELCNSLKNRQIDCQVYSSR